MTGHRKVQVMMLVLRMHSGTKGGNYWLICAEQVKRLSIGQEQLAGVL